MQVTTPSTLLLGPPGSGKTTALATLVKSDLEIFVVITEPNGLDSLLDSVERQKLPLERVHWKVISPNIPKVGALKNIATKINTMSYKGLLDLPSSDKNTQWIELLNTIENFKCDRTGRHYGDVTEWGPGRAFVIDSMTGLNKMSMGLVVGTRPAIQQHEWGIAMSQIENLLLLLTSVPKCFFVITAHVERERDEVSGSIKLMTSTLGQKLAPRIPSYFSEVVYAYKASDGFFWSTADTNVDLKNRALPIAAKLAPDFGPIVAAYQRRLKFASGDAGSVVTQPQST